MKERLLLFLNELGLSSTKLALAIGVQASSISHILSGRNKPSFDFITKLLNTYDELNADWLLLGKGSMIKEDITTNNESKTFVQADLFSQNISKTVSKTDINSEPDINTDIINEIPDVNINFNTDIEKVVIFFTDGSFKAYSNRT